jgi:hypothetical protein
LIHFLLMAGLSPIIRPPLWRADISEGDMSVEPSLNGQLYYCRICNSPWDPDACKNDKHCELESSFSAELRAELARDSVRHERRLKHLYDNLLIASGNELG